MDTEKKRDGAEVDKKCISVWEYLSYNRVELTNHLYTPPLSEEGCVHLPPLTQFLRKVTLWTDFFVRWSQLTFIPQSMELTATTSLSDSTTLVSNDDDGSTEEAKIKEDINGVTSDEAHSEQQLQDEKNGLSTEKETKSPSSSSLGNIHDYATDLSIVDVGDRTSIYEKAYLTEKKEKESLMTKNVELQDKIDKLIAALGAKGLELHKDLIDGLQ